MKQTREIMSPISVTRLFVDDGDTIGTPYAWAMRPPDSDSDDATSPSSACTP